MHADDRRPRLVLHVDQYGFLSLRCTVKKHGALMLLDLSQTTEDCILYDYVDDLKKWKCIELKVLAPVDTDECHSFAGARLRIACAGESQRLLPFSLQRGFPNATVHFLRKLYNHMDIIDPGRKPTTEAALLEALARHILGPAFSEGKMKDILIARTSWRDKGHDSLEGSPLMAGDVASVLAEEIDTSGVEEELNAARAKAMEQKARAAKHRADLESSIFSSDSVEDRLDRTRKRAVEWPDHDGLSQSEAKAYLPEGASISKEKTWHHRWKITARYMGQKSRTFDPAEVQSDHRALQFCLRAVWAAWLAGGDRTCPWDFGDDLGSAIVARA